MSEKMELYAFCGCMAVATISGAIGVVTGSFFSFAVFIVAMSLAFAGLMYYFATQ